MPDKRYYMRYKIDDYVALKDEGGAVIASDAELNSVSFKGMSLQLKQKIDVGKIVQFNFKTGLLGIILKGRAVVKNISESTFKGEPTFRVGFEYLDVNKDDVTDFLNEIQRRARENAKKSTLRRSSPDYGPF